MFNCHIFFLHFQCQQFFDDFFSMQEIKKPITVVTEISSMIKSIK